MTSSEKKYYNAKFLPKYMRVINAVVPPIIVVLLLVGMAVLFYLGHKGVMNGTIVTIAVIIMVAVLLIIVLAIPLTFRKKLIELRKAELNEEYADMSFEEAKAAFTARGVINENGFVIPSMASGGDVVPVLPYKDASIYLFSANVCSKIFTVVSFCNQSGNVMAEYLVDRELYNYLAKAGFNYRFFGGSNMLFGDKGLFVKKVMTTRENKGLGYQFLGGWIGYALAKKAQDETPEMNAVLRVLRKENI